MKKFRLLICLGLSLLAFFVFLCSEHVNAANSYVLTKDRVTISSSDGKNFSYVDGAPCGLGWDGQPSSCNSGSDRSYKGPWDYNNRYYITIGTYDPNLGITSQTIPGTLHYYHFHFILPQHDETPITINVTDPTPSTPLPSMPTYQWKDGAPPTVTSPAPENKVFSSEKPEGGTTYLPWWYKAGDGSVVHSNDKVNWLLDTPAGVSSSIICKDCPGSEFVDISVTVYKEEEKAGNEFGDGEIECVFSENTGFLNPQRDKTDSNGKCVMLGTFKYDNTVTVEVSKLVGEYKWEGSTILTFNRTGSIATGRPIIVAAKVSLVEVDLLTGAINKVIKTFYDTFSGAIGGMLGWINAELEKGSDFSNNPTLQNVSKQIRNTALGLLTLILILAAFANILNLPLADYGLTKIIPKIIISIVMAFFSYLIAIFLLEVANALQTFIVEAFKTSKDFAPVITDGKTALESAFGGNLGESYLLAQSGRYQAIILIIIFIGIFLATLWLLLILIIRKAVLLLLIAVAPLAFILNILPFTSKYYKEWWANFWKWAFMGIPICLLYYLAFVFLTTGFLGSKFQSAGSQLSGNYDQWTYLIAAGVLIYMAAMIPLKMGNTVYDAVKSRGGKALGFIGKKTGISDVLSERKAAIAARDKARGSMLRSKLVLGGEGADSRLRRIIGGVDQQQAAALRMKTIKSMGDELPEDGEALKKVIQTTTGLRQQAAVLKAASTGKLDSGDQATRAAVIRFADSQEGTNKDYLPEFERMIGKENADFFAGASIAEGVTNQPTNFFTNQAAVALTKTQPGDYKKKHWEFRKATQGDRAFYEIAGQKQVIDAALRAPSEAADAFSANMVTTGAIHQVKDADQARDIISRAQKQGILPDQTPQPQSINQAPDQTHTPSADVQAAANAARAQEAANQDEINRRLNNQQ